MKVTFILPSIGRKAGRPYMRTWQMEPLAIATLSALTPANIEKRFFDDRLEKIDYDEPTDLVALSVETYTALRAYQIAARYRNKNIPVVMGGFHPTLAPDDALEHADTIVMGEAEEIWPRLLADFSAGNMQRQYKQKERPSLVGRFPDRSIYKDKIYQQIALVETARGCKFKCEFCSITKFYGRSHNQRPVKDLLKEISTLKQRYIFFTDDNIGINRTRFKELLTALIPLKIFWAGQVSIDIADDPDLLRLMRRSGCICVLIGFESLNPSVLSLMGKAVNAQTEIYESAVAALKKHGIGVYGTFVFGYDNDNADSFQQTLDFAKHNGFFFTAFNHLVPFPGTTLYDRLKDEDRLLHPKWWLSKNYHFGDVTFRVKGMGEQQLADMCYIFRKRFYGWASILYRMTNWRANCRSLRRLFLYISLNILSANDVSGRQSLPLGIQEESI
ncbi:MAG: B12-binding domain-containing radical SAM protein [Candidatus Omnitrophica bacterium]|nr:B12-binding domain-containing radical SAM protein [Candidatus Omnitrophota bacterium]